MAMHMSMARAFLMQTLARINPVSSRGHKSCRKLHQYNVQSRIHGVRRLSVGYNKMDEEDSRKVSQYVSVGRVRPLSPLERISRLLPQEALGPEVEQLRDCDQENADERVDVIEDSNTNASVTKCHDTKNNICDSETHIHDISTAQQDIAHLSNGGTAADCSEMESQPGAGTLPNVVESPATSLPGESLVEFGELLIAEFRKKNKVEFLKMFQVQKGARIHSPWGTIKHDDIAGRSSGRILRTEYKAPFLIRRPSLEDYVLYMRRSPVITYPKVCLLSLSPYCKKKKKTLSFIVCYKVFDSRLNGDSRLFSMYFYFPPGCQHDADYDGCVRGRQCVGVRFWLRGDVTLPVPSRSVLS